MPASALPATLRRRSPGFARAREAPYALTLAAWLSDRPPIGPADPDAPGDNVDRICTRVSIGYRPTAHAVHFATPHVVRTLCGLIEARSKLFWVSRDLDCGTCAATLATREAA